MPAAHGPFRHSSPLYSCSKSKKPHPQPGVRYHLSDLLNVLCVNTIPKRTPKRYTNIGKNSKKYTMQLLVRLYLALILVLLVSDKVANTHHDRKQDAPYCKHNPIISPTNPTVSFYSGTIIAKESPDEEDRRQYTLIAESNNLFYTRSFFLFLGKFAFFKELLHTCVLYSGYNEHSCTYPCNNHQQGKCCRNKYLILRKR